jgi:two-component system chemotaxis sensor kinase CheA
MSINVEQFHQVFFEESFEGLDIMESGLLNLDLGAADAEEINTIFRAAHSIKGGSGSFGFTAISDFTHVVETLLNEMRDGRRAVTKPLVDLLLESVDVLRDLLSAAKAGEEADAARVSEIHRRLEETLHEGNGTKEAPTSTEDKVSETSGSWRIKFEPHPYLFRTGNDPFRLLRELNTLGDLTTKVDTSRLPVFSEISPEDCYLTWELSLKGDVKHEQLTEVFEWVEGDCKLEITPLHLDSSNTERTNQPEATAKSAAHPTLNSQLTAAPASQDRRLGERRADTDRRQGERRKQVVSQESSSIRVNIDKIDSLINLVGELVITQSMLSQLSQDMDVVVAEKMRDGLEQLERNTRELQESVMRIRMLPISFSFNRFPRLVHDLSSKLGKQVELKLSGEQTELDKTVLEKIGDPLVHLVRNALDHGIEIPEVRKAAGKPETGIVHLDAYHLGGNVVIEISDDGKGLDRDKILSKAREKGLVGADEQVPEERIYDFLFQPGFSTAEQVSDVSGRGVGMDVVKRNIKDLGGTVEVRSSTGAGSKFTIRLPLTLAILDGQLVRVGDETYIIPLVSIIESLQIKPECINSISGQVELFRLREAYLPIIRLYELFNLKPNSTDLNDGLLVVVDGEGQRAGIFVDDLLGQQQVVIKSLKTNYRSVKGVSGATILGDGTVALILDIPGVIECSSNGPDGLCDTLSASVRDVA